MKKTKYNVQSLRIGKLFFLLGFALMLSVGAFAQDEDENPGGDIDAPIDGGISLLVASGVAYGVKHWNNARKGKNEESKSVE